MNIFKVLASGKKPMYEEQMTSILAWLLHPQMEHGLGHELLGRFISSVSGGCGNLAKTADNLRNRLRGEAVSEFGLELEDNVSTAFIDMLISVGDWRIGVESKIYPGSVMNNQLNKEYLGLITKYGDKNCVLIYLVPADDFGELHDRIQREYNSFDRSKLRNGDLMAFMTWQENNSGYPSVVSILNGFLRDEAESKTEPIGEYIRHTLKALIMFIRGGFSGYDYERINIQNEVYPKMKCGDILNKTNGFVGIKSGMAGLIGQSADEIKNGVFQYSDSGDPVKPNWVSVDDFRQIYNCKTRGAPLKIQWDRVRLNAKLLIDIISASPGQSLYVGIKGGLRALEGREAEAIQSGSWQLSAAGESPNSQWISGETFLKVLEAKGII